MKNKKFLILSVIGILVMILSVIGLTYAWFSSSIDGSGANFNVTTATVGPLSYTGTEITANGVLPGWISEDATLKVEGTVTTSEGVNYYCTMENTGEVTDVEYRISSDGEDNSTNGTWTSITEDAIVTGSISDTNVSDEYKIAIRFKETGEDQNSQQNKTLSVRVTCEVDSTKPLYEKILADNPNVLTRSSDYAPFTAVYTESNNGNTIFKSDFTQNGVDVTTYYFAGSVTNNYVKFGSDTSGNDLYWRIVRINEDNSVRLIYAGTSATSTSGFINASPAFNISYNNPSYVGYKYTLNSQYGTGTDSEVKSIVDNWYSTNLLANYGNYISKTAIYCNDRKIGEGSWNTENTAFYYNAYTRVRINKAPTYVCENVSDQFTASASVGNNALTYPVGLITADEISFAGGLFDTNNTSYYIAENASEGVERWWTMTPYFWYESYAYEFIIEVSENTGSLDYDGVLYTYGVRPVISLKSCATWSGGDGTSRNAYTVTVDDVCAASEN